jgi:hypothetical protein
VVFQLLNEKSQFLSKRKAILAIIEVSGPPTGSSASYTPSIHFNLVIHQFCLQGQAVGGTVTKQRGNFYYQLLH